MHVVSRDDDGTDCEDSHLLIALSKLADCLAGPLDSTSVEPLVPSFPTILRGISASLSLRDVFHVDVAYVRLRVRHTVRLTRVDGKSRRSVRRFGSIHVDLKSID